MLSVVNCRVSSVWSRGASALERFLTPWMFKKVRPRPWIRRRISRAAASSLETDTVVSGAGTASTPAPRAQRAALGAAKALPAKRHSAVIHAAARPCPPGSGSWPQSPASPEEGCWPAPSRTPRGTPHRACGRAGLRGRPVFKDCAHARQTLARTGLRDGEARAGGRLPLPLPPLE